LPELFSPVNTMRLPVSGFGAGKKKNRKRTKKNLARISDFATFGAIFKKAARKLSEKTVDSPR